MPAADRSAGAAAVEAGIVGLYTGRPRAPSGHSGGAGVCPTAAAAGAARGSMSTQASDMASAEE